MKKGVTLCPVGLLCAGMLVGCGDGWPPFDELPLRDALRADPGVIAALPDDARSRLATRLTIAGAGDDATDVLEDLKTPAATIVSLDGRRSQRQADALVVGLVGDDGIAHPFANIDAGAGAASALPPLQGETAGSTAALEARALEGTAGATLRALIERTSTPRMVRVVGWPVGAIALGDTVYVGAAWLVALAPAAPAADGGAATSVPIPGAVTAAAGSTRSDAGRDPLDGGTPPDASPDTMAGAGMDAGAPPDASTWDGSFPTFVVDRSTDHGTSAAPALDRPDPHRRLRSGRGQLRLLG